MEDNNEGLPEGVVRIPLDGTYGAGVNSELTIVTRNSQGQSVETTYMVPYLALDMKRIQAICDMNLIVGYKLVKNEAKAAGLKELGL
jgi:hypothetical protein